MNGSWNVRVGGMAVLLCAVLVFATPIPAQELTVRYAASRDQRGSEDAKLCSGDLYRNITRDAYRQIVEPYYLAKQSSWSSSLSAQGPLEDISESLLDISVLAQRDTEQMTCELVLEMHVSSQDVIAQLRSIQKRLGIQESVRCDLAGAGAPTLEQDLVIRYVSDFIKQYDGHTPIELITRHDPNRRDLSHTIEIDLDSQDSTSKVHDVELAVRQHSVRIRATDISSARVLIERAVSIRGAAVPTAPIARNRLEAALRAPLQDILNTIAEAHRANEYAQRQFEVQIHGTDRAQRTFSNLLARGMVGIVTVAQAPANVEDQSKRTYQMDFLGRAVDLERTLRNAVQASSTMKIRTINAEHGKLTLQLLPRAQST